MSEPAVNVSQDAASAPAVNPSDPAHAEQSPVERGDTPFTFGQRVLQSEDDVWNHNAW